MLCHQQGAVRILGPSAVLVVPGGGLPAVRLVVGREAQPLVQLRRLEVPRLHVAAARGEAT